jgi:hypothetical protein
LSGRARLMQVMYLRRLIHDMGHGCVVYKRWMKEGVSAGAMQRE